MNTQTILSNLGEYESAPSALCLVKSICIGRELTDDECTEIYEQTEGFNDGETERLVKFMSAHQLTILINTINEIKAEHEE